MSRNKHSLCKGRKCPSTQCSDRQPVMPVMKNKDMQSREQQQKQNQVSVRQELSSTRYCKKATRCLNTKITKKPICGDDKNCQSPQFMREDKPNNAMWLKQPAMHTRKMQSNPMKRQQMQVPRKNIHILKRCNLRECI